MIFNRIVKNENKEKVNNMNNINLSGNNTNKISGVTNTGKKRFVSEIVTNNTNNNFSNSTSIKNGLDEYMFYKFDDYHFLKESDYNVIFKLPLYEKQLENLENKNEPIYKVAMLLTAEKFYKVVDFLFADSQNNINSLEGGV